jgi:peptidoglycan/xylan/chitin deacetylase (PgdA/CDA1 family)
MRVHRLLAVAAVGGLLLTAGARAQSGFAWPKGKRAAVSLSFDDARFSQVDVGRPFFEKHGVKATFFVSVKSVEKRLDEWKKMIAAGHEIGSHATAHACTGNYRLASGVMLEDFDLPRMAKDIDNLHRRHPEAAGSDAEELRLSVRAEVRRARFAGPQLHPAGGGAVPGGTRLHG